MLGSAAIQLPPKFLTYFLASIHNAWFDSKVSCRSPTNLVARQPSVHEANVVLQAGMLDCCLTRWLKTLTWCFVCEKR